MEVLVKYMIYASFALNIACGIWVAMGVVKWLKELNND